MDNENVKAVYIRHIKILKSHNIVMCIIVIPILNVVFKLVKVYFSFLVCGVRRWSSCEQSFVTIVFKSSCFSLVDDVTHNIFHNSSQYSRPLYQVIIDQIYYLNSQIEFAYHLKMVALSLALFTGILPLGQYIVYSYVYMLKGDFKLLIV